MTRLGWLVLLLAGSVGCGISVPTYPNTPSLGANHRAGAVNRWVCERTGSVVLVQAQGKYELHLENYDWIYKTPTKDDAEVVEFSMPKGNDVGAASMGLASFSASNAMSSQPGNNQNYIQDTQKNLDSANKAQANANAHAADVNAAAGTRILRASKKPGGELVSSDQKCRSVEVLP